MRDEVLKTEFHLYYIQRSIPYRAVTHSLSVIKTGQLMLYSEIIAVCSQIHTKHINTLCGQNVGCRTYRAVNTLLSVIKASQLMLYSENRCVFSDPHKTHKYAVWAESRTYRAVNTFLSVIKTSQLMLYSEIIMVVSSELHTNHINTPCDKMQSSSMFEHVVHILTAGL